MPKSLMPSAPPSRWGRRLPALFLVLPGLLGLASSAFAATLTVTNTNDAGTGSLRDVLAGATTGDTVTFDAGTFPASQNTVIALTGRRIVISRDVTVQGPGAGAVTISNSNDGILGVVGTNSAAITVRISGLTLANGNGTSSTSNGQGGGVYAYATNLTLNGCVFTGDTANGAGGAVSSNSSTLSLTGCTFSGNTALFGGAVGTSGGAASLTNCTLSGSSTLAGGLGGGVYNNGSTLTLTSCTVVGNAAVNSQRSSGRGGGLYNNDGAAGGTFVQSCLINGNSAGAGGDVSGSFTSGGSNIIGDPNGAAYGFTGPHDQVYVDPKLDPNGLRNNGGATPTIAILPGSPAIGGDFVNATATDQRGVARTAAQHTIGAFEYVGPHTHLLWNNTDGRVMLWSVAPDGSFTLHGYGPYTDNAPGNVWHATAVATGPDGKSHLLWNNTDGRVMLWTVGDDGAFTLAGYGPYTDDTLDHKWSATAVSVGPDNVVHLLWNNTDHRVMLWNVDSAFNFNLAGYGPYTDTSVSSNPSNLWSASALATGPDNVSRIAWNNADGRVMLWDVAADFSFTLAGYGPYTDGAPQNKWSAVGVSVGPDNLTHLLWNNTDRRAMLWSVQPDFSFTLAGFGPYTDDAPGNLWSAAGVATGPDGLSHLLWGNTDRRAMLWGVDNAFNFTVAGYGPYTDDAPDHLWSVTAVSAGP